MVELDKLQRHLVIEDEADEGILIPPQTQHSARSPLSPSSSSTLQQQQSSQLSTIEEQYETPSTSRSTSPSPSSTTFSSIPSSPNQSPKPSKIKPKPPSIQTTTSTSTTITRRQSAVQMALYNPDTALPPSPDNINTKTPFTTSKTTTKSPPTSSSSSSLVTSLISIPVAIASYSVNTAISLIPSSYLRGFVRNAINTASSTISAAVGIKNEINTLKERRFEGKILAKPRNGSISVNHGEYNTTPTNQLQLVNVNTTRSRGNSLVTMKYESSTTMDRYVNIESPSSPLPQPNSLYSSTRRRSSIVDVATMAAVNVAAKVATSTSGTNSNLFVMFGAHHSGTLASGAVAGNEIVMSPSSTSTFHQKLYSLSSTPSTSSSTSTLSNSVVSSPRLNTSLRTSQQQLQQQQVQQHVNVMQSGISISEVQIEDDTDGFEFENGSGGTGGLKRIGSAPPRVGGMFVF
ncbi:hypothetical protein HDU76_002439 [Blyttiomyces sp. JEL0837]|nr:hypothetical protein HDU76_002439 [Blyttiomyces sp. JEL0837]